MQLQVNVIMDKRSENEVFHSANCSVNSNSFVMAAEGQCQGSVESSAELVLQWLLKNERLATFDNSLKSNCEERTTSSTDKEETSPSQSQVRQHYTSESGFESIPSVPGYQNLVSGQGENERSCLTSNKEKDGQDSQQEHGTIIFHSAKVMHYFRERKYIPFVEWYEDFVPTISVQ